MEGPPLRKEWLRYLVSLQEEMAYTGFPIYFFLFFFGTSPPGTGFYSDLFLLRGEMGFLFVCFLRQGLAT
jgi:hypothetical protein